MNSEMRARPSYPNGPAAGPPILVTLALIAASAAAVTAIWSAWCEFPAHAWNDMRLAPAFAVRHGINPYPPLGGGPLSTWIYGPIGIFLNLPATFAPTAQTALQAAFGINLVTLLAPLAIVFFGSAELRERGRIYAWLALMLAVLFLPHSKLTFQVADHAAIACGLLSCWCLARYSHPNHGPLAAAAGLMALSAWSKQVSLFLLVGQTLYLLRSYGARVMIRYLAWTALFGFAGLGLFTARFGFGNLWFNLVELPGRLPWASVGDKLLVRPATLLAQIVLPGLVLWALWHRKAWPTRQQESGRFFQISVFAAAALLPLGIAGLLKIGGDINNVHGWSYLLPAFLLLGLTLEQGASASRRILLVVAAGWLIQRDTILEVPATPAVAHFAAANAHLATGVGPLWFPQNPVVSFYAGGGLWHSEDGLATRHLASYGIREAEFRRHLPPQIQGVAYPLSNERPFALGLLSEFSHLRRMPSWTVYTRPPIERTPGAEPQLVGSPN